MNTNQQLIVGDTKTSLPYKTIDKSLISSNHFREELLVAMNTEENLWAKRILTKVNELLDCTTVDKFWNTIPDNQSQLRALELLLKLQWMQVWGWWINLFINMPWPNDKLNY